VSPPDSLIPADTLVSAEADALRARLHLLRLAHEETRARAALAEARLRQIEASTAWRLSAPLRRVAGRHPRLVRAVKRGWRLLRWTVRGELPARLHAWRAARATRPEVVAAGIRLPRAAKPLVTVIIPCHGHAQVTLRCLAAIAAHPPRAPIEVVVVDDASGDPAVAALTRVRGLTFLAQPNNLGYLHTCNAAAAAARGEFIHLLNNDTEVRAGWLDALLEALAQDGAAAAGSKLLFPDGRLQEAGGILWTDGSGWNYGRGDDPDRPEYNYVREADWCSAASLLVRRAVWQALGGFDPAYAPAYCEDSDFAFRLRAAGWKLLYVPDSVVVHHEGASHGTDPGQGIKVFQARNQQFLRRRWQAVLDTEHYPSGSNLLRARDRASRKRVTLVLDHLVPEPDRDAGSRTIDAFLRALQESGDVVKFWPQNRHRSPGYTAALERRGIEVCYGTTPFADWMAAHGGTLDRVLVSRPAVAEALMGELVGRSAAPIVYYGHDLHHARLRGEAALQPTAELRAAKLAAAELVLAQERQAWSLADVVLYPSEDEARRVRLLSPRTDARAVVPYAFDAFPPAGPPAGRAGLIMVAGFAHPPNVDAAQWFCAEVFSRLRAQTPEVTLDLVGSMPTPAVRAIVGEGVRLHADVDPARLARLYAAARVAVVPLRYGAGVKMKTVEALQAGVPLVATAAGVQGLPRIQQIVPVRDDAEAFADSLGLLLRDDAAWQRQADAQVTYVRDRFSRAALSASLLAAFEPRVPRVLSA
jgi:GT2 family glycosyltransferase